jgi:PilZ domain/Gram-negative bacterial TonB protein C-terminal
VPKVPGSQDYFGSISDTRDRRHYSRQITALNYIKLDEGNGGILLNVSEDGLAFTAAEPLSGEFVPRLRFQVADKTEWIEASGRIVWLNDSKKGAGVQFVQISDAHRQQIRHWIESKMPLSEGQEAIGIAHRTRGEAEVTPFPAPYNDTDKIEAEYEIPESLRKMFPSESDLEVEIAHHAPSARDETFNEAHNAPQTQMSEPRFFKAVQVETLPEVHQAREQQEEETAPPERITTEQSDAPLEPLPDSAARTNPFQPSDLPGRAVRVPNFGYQTAVPSSHQQQEDLSGRIPNFGYQTTIPSGQQQEDWTNWVDPAATTHRGKLGLVVLGVLFVVAAFAIGLVFGHGSFDGLVENIRQHLPDKYQQALGTSDPSDEVAQTSGSAAANTGANATANSNIPPSSQTQTAAPQASETPTTSSPATPTSEPAASGTDSRGTPPAGASSESEADVTGKSVSAATESDSTPVLVSVASSGNGPFRLTTAEAAVSASSSVAISSQATVLVPREAGAEAVQQAKRLQLGALVFRVDPQYPKKIGRNEVEIVKLLATVGENGEVTNVQRISGPLPFATAATSAIREWKYSPTVFDGRPVKTEEKIVVAFRAR